MNNLFYYYLHAFPIVVTISIGEIRITMDFVFVTPQGLSKCVLLPQSTKIVMHLLKNLARIDQLLYTQLLKKY